jgi:nitrous-oxide reductase
MSTSKRRLVWLGIGIFCLLMLSLLGSCRKKPQVQRGGVAEAAIATYVAPGDLDEYYLFYSGGHSGNVYVAGIPSMRHISTIPVFTPYPATGYGFDKESKEMLGGFTWGDAHHPSISETKGDYDGRWLFISDNANNRMARIDLRDFKTKQGLRSDSECFRQSLLVVRHPQHRVCSRRIAFLNSTAPRHLCPSRTVRNDL